VEGGEDRVVKLVVRPLTGVTLAMPMGKRVGLVTGDGTGREKEKTGNSEICHRGHHGYLCQILLKTKSETKQKQMSR